ncbi:MAG: hypothetical protein WCS52_07250 [bacterium]
MAHIFSQKRMSDVAVILEQGAVDAEAQAEHRGTAECEVAVRDKNCPG